MILIIFFYLPVHLYLSALICCCFVLLPVGPDAFSDVVSDYAFIIYPRRVYCKCFFVCLLYALRLFADTCSFTSDIHTINFFTITVFRQFTVRVQGHWPGGNALSDFIRHPKRFTAKTSIDSWDSVQCRSRYPPDPEGMDTLSASMTLHRFL